MRAILVLAIALLFSCSAFAQLQSIRRGGSAGGVSVNRGVLTHAGNTTLDFAGTTLLQKMVATGAVTIVFANLTTNAVYDLRIANPQATNITVTLPTVVTNSFIPTYISPGKYGRFWFEVDNQTNSIVFATYAETL